MTLVLKILKYLNYGMNMIIFMILIINIKLMIILLLEQIMDYIFQKK